MASLDIIRVSEGPLRPSEGRLKNWQDFLDSIGKLFPEKSFYNLLVELGWYLGSHVSLFQISKSFLIDVKTRIPDAVRQLLGFTVRLVEVYCTFKSYA